MGHCDTAMGQGRGGVIQRGGPGIIPKDAQYNDRGINPPLI